jgi:hypothetical protein
MTHDEQIEMILDAINLIHTKVKELERTVALIGLERK